MSHSQIPGPTDWFKLALGCWLTQKFCECDTDIPGCCSTGWQTVFVSSKFNNPTTSNYHPIEGEAFAAVWALEKCKLFVLGHPKLTLVVDHKPLLAILGSNQDLTDLVNPRLLNLKLKTNAFRFTPRYVPGKHHVVPDAMSRRSDSPIADLPTPVKRPPPDNNVLEGYQDTFGPLSWVSGPIIENECEQAYIGQVVAILAGLSSCGIAGMNMDSVITWEKLVMEARSCQEYIELREAVTKGFPFNKDEWSDNLNQFRNVHEDLTVLEDIVMLQKRIVIPKVLRPIILRHLHAGHAGINGMTQRARLEVYWPDYTVDIVRVRERCHTCNANAPSNPRNLPIQDSQLPAYPFQMICMDFFYMGNKSYLAVVDKYSGWLSIFQFNKDTAINLVKAVREYFSTFGVSETICSDGAKIFASSEFQNFLKMWGVNHRISSSYFPSSNKRAESRKVC